MAAEREFVMKFTFNAEAAKRGFKELSSSYNESIGKITGLYAGYKGFEALKETFKDVTKLSDGLRQMARDASWTSMQTNAFNNQIIKLGETSGLTNEEILKMGASALKSGRDSDKMTASMKSMAQFTKAVGIEAESTGDIYGTLFNKFKMAPDQVDVLMKTLVARMSAAGRLPMLREKAGQLPDFISNMFNLNLSPEKLDRALSESLLAKNPSLIYRAYGRILSNKKVVTALRDELKLDLTKGMPDITEIMDAISKKAGGKRDLANFYYAKVFGRGFFNLDELLELDRVKELMDKKLDMSTMANKAKDASMDFSSSMNILQNSMQNIVMSMFGGTEGVTKFAASLEHVGQYITEHRKMIGDLIKDLLILTALYKGLKIGREIFGGGGSNKRMGGGLGSLSLRGSTPASPLYVAVVGGGLGGGGLGGLPGIPEGGLPGKGAKIGGLMRGLGLAGAILGGIGEGAAIGLMLDQLGDIAAEGLSGGRYKNPEEALVDWMNGNHNIANANMGPQAQDMHHSIDVTLHDTQGKVIPSTMTKTESKPALQTVIKPGGYDRSPGAYSHWK